MSNRGEAIVVSGLSDPAAGAEVSITVPAGRWWRILSFLVNFVASATAANRNPQLILDDGTTEFCRIPPANQYVASANVILTWGLGVGGEVSGLGATADAVPAPDLPLGPGFRIRTVTTNLQVGDNYGIPGLYVVEYKAVPYFQ